ncbi:proline--tRNA ligase [Patescibacteria group bacterium AH-259-L07]|nr:proline--tRNA ligase [Patescibacteria group bacterium AH-259-L07]
MNQSQLFTKTLRKDPKDAVTVSHRFLVRAGFIRQLTSGVWSLLPLGLRVYRRIENIIREEMNVIGGQEVYLPTLQPKELWQETDRWETIDPPLFKLKDRHGKWLGLGSTHEEVITELARLYIESYKDLPKAVYQIQNKFRNEMRPTGGLLRTREFVMKDLYSFHASEKDLDTYYKKVVTAYTTIYKRCGLEVVVVKASSGSIGGSESHEFMILADSGEDKIVLCRSCGWAANVEVVKKSTCPQCRKALKQYRTIEAGHTFKLGTTYSHKMQAFFTNKNGAKKSIIMGCYGIGLQRLMATIVEARHDKDGIIWPQSVAPFDIHLTGLDLEDKKVKKFVQEIYTALKKAGKDVLFDDRDESAGVKFKDADLIGIPIRLVISKKTKNKIEYKERDKKTTKLFTRLQLLDKM